MNTPSKYLHVLAAVLVVETTLFSTMLIVSNVSVTGQLFQMDSTGINNNYSNNCGNYEVDEDEGEECDDGDRNGIDGACSYDCLFQNNGGDNDDNGTPYGYCGDGNLDVREECDDGERNGKRDSYCSSCCITKPIGESRHSDDCSCGNGRKEWPEQCDEGEEKNGSSDSLCNMYCKVIIRCGNGIQDKEEECDDGNADNEDGCSNNCREAKCGDGITQSFKGEECDDGNRNDNDGCDHDCREERCGDGIEQNNEECDEGDSRNSDNHECRSDCKRAYCGDGYAQEDMGEKCDDGEKNGWAISPCDTDCTIRVWTTCGDGVKNGNEECDDGNNTNNDECTNECMTPRCGDDILQNYIGEECDEGADNGKEVLGTVHCTSDCRYPVRDTSSSSSHSENNSSDGTITQPSPGTNNQPTDDDDDDGLIVAPPPPPNENVLPAAPEEDDEDDMRAEELRQQQEEQERQLLEAMRRAREEAEQNRNEAIEENNAEENTDGLHCFDSNGLVINDRENCDREQELNLVQQEEISDAEVQEELRKKLLGENITREKNDRLIESLISARTRLDKIYNAQDYNGDVQKYFEDSIEWLDRGITYFSSAERTLEEIQQMADPVRQLVEQATALLRQHQNLPTERPDINPIVNKTEALLMKFRESFISLAQSGVQLDQESLTKYTEAANLFANVKMLCLEDTDQCTHINDVLEILKRVRGPLQEQLENNPEVYKRIQEKFEQ